MRWWLATWTVFCMLGAGCSSKNTVTEGDRQLSHQNVGAAKEIKKRTDNPAITAPATDIEINSGAQLEAWGPPEEPAPYSPAASKKSREQQKQEHEESPFWPIATGVLGTVLGMLARGTGLGGIPFIGGLISKLSPMLANGVKKNEAVTMGLQVALDEGRDYLDTNSDEIREAIRSGLPDNLKSLADKIPDGKKLVEIVRRVLNDKGLLEANTKIYDKNETGVA